MKKDVLTDKVRAATGWVLHQPVVVRLRQRFPRVTSFVAGRFDTSYFIGLPLTLVVLAGVVNMMLLSNLTESVVESDWIVTVDKHFTSMLFNMRSEWLSRTLYAITWFGDQQAVFVVGGFATLVFLVRRRWLSLVAFWLALGGVGLTVRFGKKFISRDRPLGDVAYYAVEHFSFPSGHATTSMVLFGMLAYFLYRHLDVPWHRKLLAAIAFILIVLVSFSRIYLGVHYLSDVLAGLLLGLLWLLVGISIVEVMLYRKRRYNNLHNR
ncbi:phosphatase PAP2 family protein [Pontibacter anaerobius]|uniref:Phosphatase PAP2 family protein n=1 Tax=Pontibacter anaerobius TaxID=2993940 RepID=A0ABT3RI52_9BACT|nr:phosphatase PAP2 family protein [Pontibacter anaerobius]MCX2741297.1 phosphatase PAP2 family protein [Pontibacter anaerobius]